jgi:hypothetical protein
MSDLALTLQTQVGHRGESEKCTIGDRDNALVPQQ